MEWQKHRAIAIVASVCAIAVLTCVMGWFAGRFIPGNPTVKEPAEGPESMDISWLISDAQYASHDVSAGDWLDLSDTAFSGEELDDDAAIQSSIHQFLGEDSWAVLKSDDSWEAMMPSSEIRITNARAVSAESFEEWYQDYDYLQQVLAYYDEYQTKFVVVDVELANKSDEELGVIIPWLWGDAFDLSSAEGDCPSEAAWNGEGESSGDAARHGLPLGVTMGSSLVKELYGEPSDDATSTQRHLQDGWSSIPSGDSRTYTVVYPAYRSMFASQGDYDNIDLSQMYLQIPDCGTKTMHRLRLG